MMNLKNDICKESLREIILYVIFGGLTTFISIAMYWLFTKVIKFEYYYANALSWIMSVSFAYVTNKIVVFKDTDKIWKNIFSFFGSRVCTLVVEMLFLIIGIELLNINDIFIKILVQIIVIVANYILGKFFVFRKRTER